MYIAKYAVANPNMCPHLIRLQCLYIHCCMYPTRGRRVAWLIISEILHTLNEEENNIERIMNWNKWQQKKRSRERKTHTLCFQPPKKPRLINLRAQKEVPWMLCGREIDQRGAGDEWCHPRHSLWL